MSTSVSSEDLSDWGYINSEGTKEVSVVEKQKYDELTSLYGESQEMLKMKEEEITKAKKEVDCMQESIREEKERTEKMLAVERQKHDVTSALYKEAIEKLKLKEEELIKRKQEMVNLQEEKKVAERELELCSKKLSNSALEKRMNDELNALYGEALKSLTLKNEDLMKKTEEIMYLQKTIQEEGYRAEEMMRSEKQKYDDLKGLYEEAQVYLNLKEEQIAAKESDVDNLTANLAEYSEKKAIIREAHAVKLYSKSRNIMRSRAKTIKKNEEELGELRNYIEQQREQADNDRAKAGIFFVLLFLGFIFWSVACMPSFSRSAIRVVPDTKIQTERPRTPLEMTDKLSSERKESSAHLNYLKNGFTKKRIMEDVVGKTSLEKEEKWGDGQIGDDDEEPLRKLTQQEKSFMDSIEGIHPYKLLNVQVEIKKKEDDFYVNQFNWPLTNRVVVTTFRPDNVTRESMRWFIDEQGLNFVEMTPNGHHILLRFNPFSFYIYPKNN